MQSVVMMRHILRTYARRFWHFTLTNNVINLSLIWNGLNEWEIKKNEPQLECEVNLWLKIGRMPSIQCIPLNRDQQPDDKLGSYRTKRTTKMGEQSNLWSFVSLFKSNSEQQLEFNVCWFYARIKKLTSATPKLF